MRLPCGRTDVQLLVIARLRKFTDLPDRERALFGVLFYHTVHDLDPTLRRSPACCCLRTYLCQAGS